MDLQIQCRPNGPFQTNCYIVSSGTDAWLIDAPSPAEGLIKKLDELKLALKGIYLTHGHADHIAALGELKRRYPDVKIAVGQADAALVSNEECARLFSFFGLSEEVDIPPVDILLKEGDTTDFGYTVIETPGHTPGSVCYYNEEDALCFTGDTLFEGSVGRTDLDGGDHGTLMKSIGKLRELIRDDETRILPGHGRFTRMGIEKKTNPYF